MLTTAKIVKSLWVPVAEVAGKISYQVQLRKITGSPKPERPWAGAQKSKISLQSMFVNLSRKMNRDGSRVEKHDKMGLFLYTDEEM